MPNATQGDGTSVTGSPAVPTSPEIEALRKSLQAELEASFNQRVAGFQRAIGTKDTTIQNLERQVKELRSASLSPDERAEAERQALVEENARLQAQIELAQLEASYGDVMPAYRQLLEAGSAKDQLEFLKSIRAPQTPAPVVDDKVVVPEVDLNNPQRPLLTDAMTDAKADQILGSVGRMSDITQTGARSSSQSGRIGEE